MVNLRRGIYTKEFKYTDIDGAEQTLVLRPLKGKDFIALYSVMHKFKKLFSADDKTTGEIEFFETFFQSLDAETTGILYDAAVNCLLRSYDNITQEDAEDFVSTHFLKLFPVVITLSMSGTQKV